MLQGASSVAIAFLSEDKADKVVEETKVQLSYVLQKQGRDKVAHVIYYQVLRVLGVAMTDRLGNLRTKVDQVLLQEPHDDACDDEEEKALVVP